MKFNPLGGGNMSQMMKQAKKMQEEMAKTQAEVLFGGGLAVMGVVVLWPSWYALGWAVLGSLYMLTDTPEKYRTEIIEPARRTIEALIAHINAVVSAAPGLPFYYYDIPALTGVSFPMAEFLERSTVRVPTLDHGASLTSRSSLPRPSTPRRAAPRAAPIRPERATPGSRLTLRS